ncbi:serine/threonine protein kinase [Clostridium cavendishii DSM 21758]|uniref:non-specific serine/threonine protein kinase n=1 Tax=Clostridium cavendishii DSM 21758 TaxID=1121302 RepID=A0A1M6LP26_9CLOT|nr:serine/threonine-protein kinase [Clostridium cavendishii]SHJ72913.1 serine/threonine protein kinase [Clostridium cavendishii DSM 21758]
MSEVKGKIIDGRYKITDILGRGGMSIVYKAISLNLEKEWAIKEITFDSNSDVDFLAEPNILKNLDHPALPRIVDIINKDEKIYIVLDYIDGTNLNTLLNQCTSFQEDKVIGWAKEICDVLIYLHNQKPNPIIYRDMKPGNLMLNKQGHIKLIDFGIAREYKENTEADTVVIGTRGYAAPEQYGNHQTDQRTDIYSLGVTLYHLLTGKGPNDPPYELLPVRSINNKFSEGIEYIIIKCTKQDPHYRYQNVEELLEDLNNIDKLSAEYKIQKRRSKGKFFIASLIISILFVGSGIYKINSVKTGEYLNVLSAGDNNKKSKKYDVAISKYNEAIKQDPKRDEGYLNVAKLYYDTAQFDKLINYLKIEAPKENEKITKNEEYSYLLGLACFAKSDYKGSEENFNNVKSNNFDGIEFYRAISKALNKPGNLSKDDEATKVVSNLRQYIEQQTDAAKRVRGYIMLSDLYAANAQVFDNNIDSQIELLEKAIAQSEDKSNTALYEKLAQAYNAKAFAVADDETQRNKYSNLALNNYKILENLGYETSSLYYNIGNIERTLKNIEEAESYYNKLVKKYPKDFKGYMGLAKLNYDRESKKDAASRDYSKFVENYKLAEQNNSAENNPEINNLKVLYKEIQKQGYIK